VSPSEPRALKSSRSDPVVIALRVVVLGLGAVLGILFLWVVVARFVNPVDAEWMTGAVRESVERVRRGEQLYVAPSAAFIPFVYTPIYVWLSACLAHLCSVFVACRIVSLAATAATAWGISRLASILGASRFWSVVGVLLHFGTYSVTLFFFDIERVDALASAFVVIGLVVLLGGNGGTLRTALGGVILGLAFFAKQPGLLAFAAALSGLALARERRRALVVLVTGAAVFALALGYLEMRSGGWFRYYCVKLPRIHGVDPARLSTFFLIDLPKVFVLAAGSAAIAVPVAWSAIRRRAAPEGMAWREVVFAAVVTAGFAGAFFLRAHRGGWANVIVAWTPLGCAAATIAASRMERLAEATSVARPVSLLLLAGVTLQLLGNAFDPNESAPDSADKAASDRFTSLVRKLEERGEVVVTTAGSVTRTPHFHAAALHDVLRAGDHAPADYLAAIRERRYAAIFVGSPDEFACKLASCTELSNATLRNYFVAARLEEREKTGMIGFDGRPRWVLRPRRTPLETLARTALDQRIRQEMGIAHMQRLAAPPEAEVVIDDEIEQLASHTAATTE
jgi:hypothetical protein